MEDHSRTLRFVFGQFATGVTVVSFVRDGRLLGMTVNSFTSVSLEPPMVLFCPALGTRFAESVQDRERFTISILSESQKDLCLHFAGLKDEVDVPWAPDPLVSPPPILGCLAWLNCEVESWVIKGDHLVVYGEILLSGLAGVAQPLLFFRGQYPKLNT